MRGLAVLDYMFCGSCRRVSKVLSIALEPISKSTVTIASGPKPRRCIAVDETKPSPPQEGP